MRQVANCHTMPESLLSGKYADTDLCGLTIKHIHNTCQEKAGWVSKEVKKTAKRRRKKKETLESLLSHQGEKPRGAPQGGIKQQKMQKQAFV